MDIITNSVKIKGTTDAAGAIIRALCAEDATTEQKWDAINRVAMELHDQYNSAMLPDTPPETQAEIDAIVDYREELRNLQLNYLTPEQVIFPELP